MTRQPTPGLHENFAEKAAMSADKAMVTDAERIASQACAESAKDHGIMGGSAYDCALRAARLALSAALAQAEQPVAWMHPTAGWASANYDAVLPHCRNDGPKPIPLYAHPPAKREAGEAPAPSTSLMGRILAYLDGSDPNTTSGGDRNSEMRDAVWKELEASK